MMIDIRWVATTIILCVTVAIGCFGYYVDERTGAFSPPMGCLMTIIVSLLSALVLTIMWMWG